MQKLNVFKSSAVETHGRASHLANHASQNSASVETHGRASLNLSNTKSSRTFKSLSSILALWLILNAFGAASASAQLYWSGSITLNHGQNITQDIILTGNVTIYVYGDPNENIAGISGVISSENSSYTITKAGEGSLYFYGGNHHAYEGETIVQNGWLFASGSLTGGVTVDGGTFGPMGPTSTLTIKSLNATGGFVALGGNLVIGTAVDSFDGGGTCAVNIIDGFYPNAGAGTLTKQGIMPLYLTGENTYTNNTIINSGFLSVGNATPTGSIAGNIINNSILLLNRSNSYTYDGVISGTGSVSYGTGTPESVITLANHHSYTGETRIYGTLVLTETASIQNSMVVMANVISKFDVSAKIFLISGLSSAGTTNSWGEVILGEGYSLCIGNDAETNGGGNYRGIFSGTGSVMKSGNDTFTMNNSGNTATGAFLALEGEVIFAGNWNGNFRKYQNAILNIVENCNVAGNLELRGGVTAFNLTGDNPSKITAAGALETFGTNTLYITDVDSETPYNIITAASGVTTTPFTVSGELGELHVENNQLFFTSTGCFTNTFAPQNGLVEHLPMYVRNNYSYTQQIYRPHEVERAGFISKIDFNYVANTSITRDNVSIYMANVTKNEFYSEIDWVPTSDLQKVFEGTIVFNSNSWVTIELDTHFEYNGVDNLLVAVLNNHGASNTINDPFAANTNPEGEYVSLFYYNNYNTPLDITDVYSLPPYAGGFIQDRNNMKFTICEEYEIWPPADIIGNGSEEEPWLIENRFHMKALADFVNEGKGSSTNDKYYKLMNNIDLSAYSSDEDGKGWKPIGYFNSFFNMSLFRGNFDGNGKVVRNLTIDRPTLDNVGLFGYTSGSTITNLGIENASIVGNASVGALVGYAGGTIQNCYSSGTVTGIYWNVGGLVGESQSSITNSYSTCDVSGDARVGGLVGYSQTMSPIENCYASGNITGNAGAAGVVGTTNGTPVRNCVAANPSITVLSDVTNMYRIMSSGTGTTINNYALETMLLTANGVPFTVTPDLNGREGADATLEQLQSRDFYTSEDNWLNNVWDITDESSSIWNICEDKSFPWFRYQNIECDIYWTILAEAGENGSIEPSGYISVIEGESQTFDFIPDEGYEIDRVSIDGLDIPSAVENGYYTFENVTRDWIIYVSFKPKLGIDVETYGRTSPHVYPNPTSGKFSVISFQLSEGSVEIYDISGRKLLTFKLDKLSTEIDISHLANGIYFVKVGNETIKIVKN